MESNSVYRAECVGDKYYFLDSQGARVQTPRGNDVFVCSDALVEDVLDELSNHQEDLGRPFVLLTYLYSYCDRLAVDPEGEELRQNLVDACGEMLVEDGYLMFRQSAPAAVIVASAMQEMVPEVLEKMDVAELVAFQCLAVSYESLMLPYYVYCDVLSEVDGDWTNFSDLLNGFTDDMRSFLVQDEEDTDEDELNAYLSRMFNSMAKFCAACCL